MNYEKKYKEALERARALKNGKDVDIESGTTTCEYIFPELMESEDEKIRKSLLSYLHGLGELEYPDNTTYIKWLTWLEKQGEHKPSDNVESKFKVGDWIVCDGCCYPALIVNIDGDKYEIKFTDGAKGYHRSGLIHKAYHRWTIEDAKDGDVLAFYYEHKGNKMEQVGIIKKYVGRHGGCSNSFNIYVGLDWENNLQIGEYMGSSDIQPATKEQRDRLEKEITKAGYRWNKEERKLEKI